MKKMNYIFMLLLLMVCIPKVYAFSYEFTVDAGELSVSSGTTKTVNVYVKNIKDVNKGVLYCDFEVHGVGGVEITGDVTSSSEWKMTNNGFYIFNAVNPINRDTKIFSVPIKVNSAGTLSVIDIKCYDGSNSVLSIPDVYTKFTIAGSNTGSSSQTETSHNYLSDIKLSEGKIKFDPKVKEYTVEANDFASLVVEPVLAEAGVRYSVNKESVDNKDTVYIMLTGLDGSNDMYTINVEKKSNSILSENSGSSLVLGLIVVIIIVVIVFLIIRYKEKIMDLIKKIKK